MSKRRALDYRRFMNASPEDALEPENAAETVFLADCDADDWNASSRTASGGASAQATTSRVRETSIVRC